MTIKVDFGQTSQQATTLMLCIMSRPSTKGEVLTTLLVCIAHNSVAVCLCLESNIPASSLMTEHCCRAACFGRAGYRPRPRPNSGLSWGITCLWIIWSGRKSLMSAGLSNMLLQVESVNEYGNRVIDSTNVISVTKQTLPTDGVDKVNDLLGYFYRMLCDTRFWTHFRLFKSPADGHWLVHSLVTILKALNHDIQDYFILSNKPCWFWEYENDYVKYISHFIGVLSEFYHQMNQ